MCFNFAVSHKVWSVLGGLESLDATGGSSLSVLLKESPKCSDGLVFYMCMVTLSYCQGETILFFFKSTDLKK